jgi:hypothetical protein
MSHVETHTATTRQRAVFVVHRPLEGLTAGNDVYLLLCLKAAGAAGYDLAIVFAPAESFANRPFARVAPGFAEIARVHWPSTARIGGGYLSLSAKVWLRFARRLGLEALRRLGAPLAIRSRLGDVPAHADLQAVARLIDSLRPDMVVADYSSLGPVFALSRAAPVRAVLLHDLFSCRAENFRSAGRAPDHTEITIAQEAVRVANATDLFFASRDEMTAFAPFTPHQARHWLRPNVRPRRADCRAQPPAAVFIGTNHAGNRDALDHLLREIWPLVLGSAPHARLRIFGRIAETVRLPLPDGVTAEGPVADLAVLAGPDMIGLAPTRLASGISIKIADYLALGQPVVSYPAGVAGFGDALQSAIALADTPEGFAQATAELLADPSLRHARSQAGLSLVEQLFATSGVEAAFAGSARTASAA